MASDHSGARAKATAGRTRRWLTAITIIAAALTIAAVIGHRYFNPVRGLRATIADSSSQPEARRAEFISRGVDLDVVEQDPSLPQRMFRMRWEGVWHMPETRWIDLYAGADDRIAVWIDGRLVIERSLALGQGTGRVRMPLSRGNHHLAVEYEQGGGGYSVNLQTGPAGGVWHPFARELVFPSTPSLRTLRTIRALNGIDWTAAAAWVGVVLAACSVKWGRWIRDALRQAATGWLMRHGTNWRLWRGAEPAAPADATDTRSPHRRVLVLGAYALTVLAGLGLFSRYYDAQTGFTSLIGFGGRFSDGVHPSVRAVPHFVYADSSGYDGQYYAQLAVDPHLRNSDHVSALDSVPYRTKRMLFSWTAFALGLGNPAWVLQAYAVQNILAWLLLAVLLSRWLPPVSVRHWVAWCGCLFSFGLVFSIRFSLTEGPTLVLIAFALAAAEEPRAFTAAALLGIAGLGRETAIAAAPGIYRNSLERRSWWRAIVMGLLVVGPLLLWLTYLRSLFGPRVWSAGGDNLTLPLADVIGKVEKTILALRMDGWTSPAIHSVLALVSTAVQVVYLAWRVEWQSSWWRAGLPYALLATVLAKQVLEGDPGAFPRILLPLTVAFNVLVVSSGRFWLLFVLGNLSILTTAWLLWPGFPR